MTRIVHVGAGGWHEYPQHLSPGTTRLKAYSKKFNFVEVNSTFYRIFHPRTVEAWRRSVPNNFRFSVKCYKALTHEIGPRPIEDAFRVFDLMLRYCKILGSEILVLESPAFVKLDNVFVTQAMAFFSSITDNSIRIAWEFRRSPSQIPDNVISLMQDLLMIHVTDLTFEDPRYDADILYTRVFGRPAKKNVLDSQDLKTIQDKVSTSKSDTAYVVGHSLRMMEEAELLKQALLAG